MSDSEDPIDPIDEGGDDLFGDDDDGDVIESPKERVLDDDDLASDPEGETYNRYRDDDDTRQQDEVTRETMIADVTAYRHPIPKPSDGIVSTSAVSMRAIHLLTLFRHSCELCECPSFSSFSQKNTTRKRFKHPNLTSPMPDPSSNSTSYDFAETIAPDVFIAMRTSSAGTMDLSPFP